MFCLALLAGCQTQRVVSSDGRPLPEKPRAAPIAPESALVNRMAFMVGGKPEDTNRSGYPDLVRVTAALFATPHPTAVRQDGAFVFELYAHGRSRDAGARPMAEWRFEGEQVKLARGMAPWGPCYHFALDLTAKGVEVQPLAAGDLRATFLPANGAPPVHSDGVRSIQIGRR